MSGSTNQLAVRIGPTGRMGSLAGLVAGPFFRVSVGLNTWASLDYLQSLGWQFVGGEQVPWPSSLARGPFAWVQIATFALTGFLVIVFALTLPEALPRRRSSRLAVVLVGLLGAALGLAAFRVDVPMLTGGSLRRGTAGCTAWPSC